MSDRQTSRRRRYLLLAIAGILLLSWFAFAPGNDQQNADNKDTKTSQKQESNKDNEDKTEGQVASVATTEPSAATESTATSTWKPSPNVKVASVVTGTPQQPVPQNPQTPPTPPVEPEEPAEPECEVYDGQVIAVAPGESSGCYILANENEALGCWMPFWPHAFDDESTPVFWLGDLSDIEIDFPYLVVENKSTLGNDLVPIEFCPAFDTYLQFHVRAPEDAASANLPGMDYDYIFPVLNINVEYLPGEDAFDETVEPEITCHEIHVNVLGDDMPADPDMMIDCAMLEDEFLPARPV